MDGYDVAPVGASEHAASLPARIQKIGEIAKGSEHQAGLARHPCRLGASLRAPVTWCGFSWILGADGPKTARSKKEEQRPWNAFDVFPLSRASYLP